MLLIGLPGVLSTIFAGFTRPAAPAQPGDPFPRISVTAGRKRPLTGPNPPLKCCESWGGSGSSCKHPTQISIVHHPRVWFTPPDQIHDGTGAIVSVPVAPTFFLRDLQISRSPAAAS